MLEVRKLACFVRDRRLFDPISFVLPAGSILQISGENGIGKSSLLRCIVGLPVTHVGEIYLCQHCIFIGHQHMLHMDLTVQQNLDFFGAVPRDLDHFAIRQLLPLKIRELSAGQKQRVSLTRLLSSDHKLWVLDEPLVNLDSSGKQVLLMLMQQHLARQGAVLLANHEALGLGDQLCLV